MPFPAPHDPPTPGARIRGDLAGTTAALRLICEHFGIEPDQVALDLNAVHRAGQCTPLARITLAELLAQADSALAAAEGQV